MNKSVNRSLSIITIIIMVAAILVTSCSTKSVQKKRTFELNNLFSSKAQLLKSVAASGSPDKEKQLVIEITNNFLKETYLDLDTTDSDVISNSNLDELKNDWEEIRKLIKPADSIKSAKANISKLFINYDNAGKPVLASIEFDLQTVYGVGKTKMNLITKGSFVLAKSGPGYKIIDYKINNAAANAEQAGQEVK